MEDTGVCVLCSRCICGKGSFHFPFLLKGLLSFVVVDVYFQREH